MERAAWKSRSANRRCSGSIALTGFVKNVEPDRIQLMGRTEIGYLKTLPEDDRITLLNSVFAVGFPAVVISAGLPAPEHIRRLADIHGIALITTDLESSAVIERLNNAMFGWLAPREVRHAVLAIATAWVFHCWQEGMERVKSASN